MDEQDNEILRHLLQHRAEIFGFIRAVMRNANEAEDVFQNVALDIIKEAHKSTEIGNFQAWAKQVARNHIHKLYRQSKSQRPKTLPSPEMLGAIEQVVMEKHLTLEQASLESRFLVECMKDMPSNVMEIVRMRLVEGNDYSQLAARFSRNENSIRQIVFRARAALASCIRKRLSMVKG